MRTRRDASTEPQVVNAGRDAVALARSYHSDDIDGADTMLISMAVLLVVPHFLVGRWPWQLGSLWHDFTHRPYDYPRCCP
jgi:hypothetical protein